MKNRYIITLLSLMLIMVGLTGCYDQEVEDPVAPGGVGGYINVEITTDHQASSYREGDTLIFNITMDRTADHNFQFDVVFAEDSEADAHDIEISGGSIAPYQTTGTITMIIVDEEVSGEAIENLKFSIEDTHLETRYLINPSQVYPSYSYSIQPPALLYIDFGWDSAEDYDFVIYKDNAVYPLTSFSANGATTANPESDNSILVAEVGTYYIGLMNWGAPSVNYSFLFGYPDGSTETLTGAFDADDLSKYYVDFWTGWGSHYASYRVMKIVNDGTNFTITKLDDLTCTGLTVNDLIGNWYGTDIDDESGYHNYVTDAVDTKLENDTLQIMGIGFNWMKNFWGEEILDSNYVNVDIDWDTDSVFISEQQYMTTFYDGAEQDPYTIKGSGVIINKCANPTLIVKYELTNYETGWAAWCYENGYLSTELFEAYLTIDNSGKLVVLDNKRIGFDHNLKPIR